MREINQSAYILINRPYSETSWVVEVFCREFGRIALMAKGARQQKSKLKGVLMPFQPVLLSWSGKGEVPTLVAAEVDQSDFNLMQHELSGDALVCGFYCNELITNLLQRNDPHTALFDRYHQTLMALASVNKTVDLPTVLRDFEITVMKETGYAIDFQYEAGGQKEIEELGFYCYQSNQGFVRVATQNRSSFSGRVIKSLDSDQSEPDGHYLLASKLTSNELSQAKQLMRDILKKTLGQKNITSRELFYPKTENRISQFKLQNDKA